MNLKSILLLCILFPGYLSARDTLCTPNPSKEAKALFRYLKDIHGKKTLSGQMVAPWGIDELKYIQTYTGKQPAVMGVDFIHQNVNNTEAQNAINWWKAGGIPTIMWHWGAPGIGEGYENSKKKIDIDKCFQAGTLEYQAFWTELKTKADLLIKTRDANVPIIWRPYHELNGGWFWWSMQGPEKFKKLWITMYDYFVKDRGINNLIWNLCYTANADTAWYPGDKYVDIVGGDTYGTGSGPQLNIYNGLKKIAKDNIIISYHECGIPPDPDLCIIEGAVWSWWMEWHTSHLEGIDKTYLKNVYNHDLVITFDELPSIISDYGWDAELCQSSKITFQTMTSENIWANKNIIPLNATSTAKIKVQATNEGYWSWTGYGLSGAANEQSFVVKYPGIVSVQFHNNCGATSTQTFYIYDTCTSSPIVPYIKVSETDYRNINYFTILYGKSVTLSPQPANGGSWKWSGCGTNETSREQTISPETTCSPVVHYTNSCGKTSTLTYNITVKGSPVNAIEHFENYIRLSPNPCSNLLHIDFASQIISNIVSIFTIDGKLLYTNSFYEEKTTINTSGLDSDYYILIIENKWGRFVRNFIKTK